jgi:K+-transporting ATPase A subunit
MAFIMSISSILTAVALLVVLLPAVKPLGSYMDEVFAGRPHIGSRLVGTLERSIYRGAWNTAVSFVTTTDWQFYNGESTMSYFS